MFKAGLYENFVKGMLDKAEYKSLRDGYSERMEELRSAIDQLRQEMERVTDRTSERQKWAQQFREFSNMTELDRRAVVTLIQSIRIISKTELKITFRYQMKYDAALQKLSQAFFFRNSFFSDYLFGAVTNFFVNAFRIYIFSIINIVFLLNVFCIHSQKSYILFKGWIISLFLYYFGKCSVVYLVCGEH